MFAVSLWSDRDGGAGPATATGASSTHTLAPAPATPVPPPTSDPSARATGTTEPTRLRNRAADLCLDVRDEELREGAGARLAVCSSAWTQQWSYEQDGLLRSVADPGLCLGSHADNGVLSLVHCVLADAKRSEDMRYDLTVRGELLPRRDEGQAVAPQSADPDADVLVAARDGSDAQRWRTDGPAVRPDSASVGGEPASPSPSPSRSPSAGRRSSAAGDGGRPRVFHGNTP